MRISSRRMSSPAGPIAPRFFSPAAAENCVRLSTTPSSEVQARRSIVALVSLAVTACGLAVAPAAARPDHANGAWWSTTRGEIQLLKDGPPYLIMPLAPTFEQQAYIDGEGVTDAECRGIGKRRVYRYTSLYRHLRCRLDVYDINVVTYDVSHATWLVTLHPLSSFPRFEYELWDAHRIG
jgi:hypothetical protein